MQDEIEDLRNRAMRKTNIFHGFPESKSKYESWEQSKQLITQHLGKCGIKGTKIDRAHRVNRKNSSEIAPRPIYAEFQTWQDSS